ncbi:unnamed protein product, partial [Closterium sp. NIES-53]
PRFPILCAHTDLWEQEQGVDFMALEERPLDSMLTNVDASGHLYGVAGGSGGYAEAVLRYAALELFGVHVPPGPLEWQQVRNADMRECSVAVDRQHVLRVACAYGFRNIQNVLRRAKQGRCPYHYVEVMACPGGESGGVGSRGAGGGGESRMYQYHHVEVMACPRGRGGWASGGVEVGVEGEGQKVTREFNQKSLGTTTCRSWLAPEVRGGAGAGGVEVGVRERDRTENGRWGRGTGGLGVEEHRGAGVSMGEGRVCEDFMGRWSLPCSMCRFHHSM